MHVPLRSCIKDTYFHRLVQPIFLRLPFLFVYCPGSLFYRFTVSTILSLYTHRIFFHIFALNWPTLGRQPDFSIQYWNCFCKTYRRVRRWTHLNWTRRQMSRKRMIVVTRTSANAKESSGKAKSVSFPMVWTNQRPIDAEAERRLGFPWLDLTLVLNSEPFVILSWEFLNYSLLCKLSNSQFFLVHPNSWTSFVVDAVHHLIFAWAGSTPFLEPFFHFLTPLKLLFSCN